MAKLTTEQLKWRAEDDARTLATYQEILQDKKRMSRAVAAAKQQASNLTQRASIMQKAAGINKSKGKK